MSFLRIHPFRGVLAVFLLAFGLIGGQAASLEEHAKKLTSLIDPAKLATLKARGANPRIQKAVAILAAAEADKVDPGAVCTVAVKATMTNAAAAELTRATLLRNLDIARKLGCLSAEGLEDMRHGRAPTVARGPYTGDELSVDHIIPRAVVPELDNIIANLELLPLRLNERKNSKVGQRQVVLAQKFFSAGLLTLDGLQRVKMAAK